MNYEQALTHFGTGRAIAKALGVSPGRISQCKSEGGALQAREEDEPKRMAS